MELFRMQLVFLLQETLTLAENIKQLYTEALNSPTFLGPCPRTANAISIPVPKAKPELCFAC